MPGRTEDHLAARHDTLTEIANRFHFHETLDSVCRRNGLDLAKLVKRPTARRIRATQTAQNQPDTAGGKTSDRSQDKDVKVQHQPGAAGTSGSESSSEGASTGTAGDSGGSTLHQRPHLLPAASKFKAPLLGHRGVPSSCSSSGRLHFFILPRGTAFRWPHDASGHSYRDAGTSRIGVG